MAFRLFSSGVIALSTYASSSFLERSTIYGSSIPWRKQNSTSASDNIGLPTGLPRCASFPGSTNPPQTPEQESPLDDGVDDESYIAFVAYTTEADKPRSYKQVKEPYDTPHWDSAMKEELDALYLRNTWSTVPISQERNIIGNKEVYKVK